MCTDKDSVKTSVSITSHSGNGCSVSLSFLTLPSGEAAQPFFSLLASLLTVNVCFGDCVCLFEPRETAAACHSSSLLSVRPPLTLLSPWELSEHPTQTSVLPLLGV